MKDFAALFTALDQTGSTLTKTAALAAFFREASDDDKMWTIALLSGRRPKRTITSSYLKVWAAEQASIPLWLFEESYAVVGDLAETISLLLPAPTAPKDQSLTDWIAELRHLSTHDEAEKKKGILAAWAGLGGTERFVFTKLCTGGFRVGVSQKLMTRALAEATGQDEATMAHRLMGGWHPDTHTWETLVEAPDPTADLSKPYPFQLAYALEDAPEDLGPPGDWLAEWKWDGIRAQVIRRGGALFIWSRGEELMTDRFPELSALLDHVPDGTVLDGELLAWDHAQNSPLPFAQLQKRIGRKTVPKTLLKSAPVLLLAYDLLEADAGDLRHAPLSQRRKHLADVLQNTPHNLVQISNPVEGAWEERATSRSTARERGAEGLMLKRLDAPYIGGRKKGDWWKWKLDPLTIDAVMIYAQAGHGRRANLFTDYTFAVWKGDELVPFTKAYSGLTDREFREATDWVKKNTLERFGPVRRVPPHHVFEIGFEGIQASSRHKSGVALRFPRMLRWRHDKAAQDANTHDDLLEMLTLYG